MFARTILAFSNVSSPYESYNTLNSQGEFAISEEGRSPWARAPSGNKGRSPWARAGIAILFYRNYAILTLCGIIISQTTI